MLDARKVSECLAYDENTGVLTWKVRPLHHFRTGWHSQEHNCRKWNAKFAGKVAGSKRSDGYIYVAIDNRKYAAHVLALIIKTGAFPSEMVDHRDGIRDNNRWANLREATNAQNMANCPLSKASSTGLKGVCLDKWTNSFKASITVGGKTIHLGRFKTAEEAHAAYSIAAEQYFGQFARVS